MSVVVVTESEDDETEDIEDALEEVEEAVEEAGEEIADAVEDAVDTEITLDHEQRITRMEERLNVAISAMESLAEKVVTQDWVNEYLESRVNLVSEQQDELGEATADVIEEVVEAESDDGKIDEDEAPSIKEHWLFRRWGRK